MRVMMEESELENVRMAMVLNYFERVRRRGTQPKFDWIADFLFEILTRDSQNTKQDH